MITDEGHLKYTYILYPSFTVSIAPYCKLQFMFVISEDIQKRLLIAVYGHILSFWQAYKVNSVT